MAGDRQRVMQLLDASVEAAEAARAGFDAEYPAGPTPPSPGPIIRVAVGDDVQAALTQARHEGATLLLAPTPPGQGHLCNLKVTDDPAAKPVIISSDTDHLPPPGTRCTRDYEPALAFLQSANNSDPVIRYQPRSTGVDLIGIGVRPLQHGGTMIVFGTDTMQTPDEQPTGIVHDRLLLLGDPARGQKRGIQAHVRGYVLSNSSLLEMHLEGQDSQCLLAYSGGQYLWLRNNHFEGGAVNVQFGGSDANTDALAPQHVLIERNRFSKNPAWASLAHRPNIKCLFEAKHLRHAVLRLNTFTQNWAANWPSGVALMVKCCDQYGREPWTLTEDILIERNRVSQVGMFLAVVGKNDAGHATQLLRDLTVRHNLITEMETGQWQGTGYAMDPIAHMPDRFTFDHQTLIGNWKGISQFSCPEPRGQAFAFTNTVIWQGDYGLKGPAGMNAWHWEQDLGYAPTVSGNAIRRDPTRKIDFGPGNVIVPEADFDASFNADHSIRAGSAIAGVVTTDGQPQGCDVTRLPQQEAERAGVRVAQ